MRTTVVIGLTAVILASGLPLASADTGGAGVPAAYRELMEHSMEQKFGLEFYVKGQIIPGVVTAFSDDGVVEVRNQRRERIVIRVDRIDALGR